MLATASIENNENSLKVNWLRPWLVCFSAALFFFYEFIQMGMFNSLAPELMKAFNVNATQISTLSATYFYADVIFLFIAGLLLDRFSVRKILLCAAVLCTVSTFVFAVSTSVIVASVSHFAAGIGNAFCFLSCIKLSNRWFPPRKLAFIIGLIVTIAMMGGVVAQTPLTMLADAVGWRHAVMVDGFLGIFIILLNWYFVADFPSSSIGASPVETNDQSQGKLNTWFALRNSQNWLAGLYTCLLNLPIFLLGDLWGVMYLTQVHNIPRLQASYITSMVFFGTIIGSPIVGWLSDTLGQRRLPMMIGAILSLAVISLIIFVPSLSFIQLLCLFLLLGIFTSAQIISYPAIAESNPKKLTGTASGLASILIMGGGAVFQPFFGWLMDLHHNNQLVAQAITHTHADFMRGMMIMPIAFSIGLVAAFLMKETYCQPFEIAHK